jgi:hypothetical protein
MRRIRDRLDMETCSYGSRLPSPAPHASSRACSVSVETDHALDSLFGRIFYGKPVSTFPENALGAAAKRAQSTPGDA